MSNRRIKEAVASTYCRYFNHIGQHNTFKEVVLIGACRQASHIADEIADKFINDVVEAVKKERWYKNLPTEEEYYGQEGITYGID